MSGVTVHHGDSRDIIKTLADSSIAACVTDPPYALVSIVRRFGKEGAAPATPKDGAAGAYARASAGFMGKAWDTGETAFDPAFWAEVLRVLKPGAHLVAFGGTRSYHRLACAIEDAGFEVRDQIGWLYGSGFPKSHSVERATGRPEGAGWGTALKPAWEPIVLGRKPLIGTVAANVLAHGTGALNVDGCRIEGRPRDYWNAGRKSGGIMGRDAEPRGYVEGNPNGRWPANVIHDGSNEVVEAFPQTSPSSAAPRNNGESKSVSKGQETADTTYGHADNGGSAARFFYSAKADADDRCGSKHPTVKPTDLMAWLVRLVTPPGGIVLDPFAGSGSTGMACLREGFDAVLIEREAEYVADIHRRIAHVEGGDMPLFSAPTEPGLFDGEAA